MKYRNLLGIAVAMSVVVTACGDTTAQPAGDSPVVAGACLEGVPDCVDTVGLGPGDPDHVPSQGVPVASVVETKIDGGFAIEGFYFADETGVRLCEALAESFPPQCGGASIPFVNTAGAELGELSTEQGITWSDQPILVVGSVIDGVFVAE